MSVLQWLTSEGVTNGALGVQSGWLVLADACVGGRLLVRGHAGSEVLRGHFDMLCLVVCMGGLFVTGSNYSVAD